MLVKCISDLHLHGTAPFRYVDHGEYVCVLAGDIAEGVNGLAWAMAKIPQHIKVLYVPGNHEYYGHDYALLNARFRAHNRMGTNVHVLLNETVTIGDVDFVGTTLWADFNLYGNQELYAKEWYLGLNDSIYIRNNGGRIGPADFIRWHDEAKWFIKNTCETPTTNTRVLITHYCHELSVAPQYRNDPLTPGFAVKIPVDMHEKFKVHFHGHTHASFDYETNYGTRVVCNPRGYGAENLNGFNDELVIDI